MLFLSSNGSAGSSTSFSLSYSKHSAAAAPARPLSPLSPDVPATDAPNASVNTPRSLRQRSGTHSKKRSSAADFTLPPPPTRARKIIQMKPKTQTQTQNHTQQAAPRGAAAATATAAGPEGKTKGESHGAGGAGGTGGAGSKKKQGNGPTTAAGRKIARKTAHSLIERRRRSKMNEEFATLKNMIPACRGQEMHKLAILQVTCPSPHAPPIDYMNYLEQCLKDLKAANRNGHSSDRTDSCGPSTSSTPCANSVTRTRNCSLSVDREYCSSSFPSPSRSPSPAPSKEPLHTNQPAFRNGNSTTASPGIHPGNTNTHAHGYYEHEYEHEQTHQLHRNFPRFTHAYPLLPSPALLPTSSASSSYDITFPPIDPHLHQTRLETSLPPDTIFRFRASSSASHHTPLLLLSSRLNSSSRATARIIPVIARRILTVTIKHVTFGYGHEATRL
ncbi:HLH transcription factor [Histoplasma capsulatum H143]|uniref:HLH transcription factor n=1 Tax=Ajellomyces capsulatus (strain H143) TaxID=544712 RepID=C6HCS2_AJECH|nr:HLH transcription factor [Histoplasma capsulatum H143]